MTNAIILVSGAVVGAALTVVLCLWALDRFMRSKSQMCQMMAGICIGLGKKGAESLRVFIDDEPLVIPLHALAQAFANADLLTHEPVRVERPATPPPPPRDYDGRA